MVAITRSTPTQTSVYPEIKSNAEPIVKNILHEPLSRLRENEDGKYGLKLAQVLVDLFGLEESKK